MSDITPQTVFGAAGYDEDRLVARVVEQLAAAQLARKRFPRIRAATLYVIERGREPSSWAGVCGLLAIVAPQMSADAYPEIAQLAGAACALIALAFRDRAGSVQ